MKSISLPLFKCPSCSAHDFSLQKEIENEQEVKEGNLICQDCGKSYLVRDGLVFLYDFLSEEVVQEQMAYDKEIVVALSIDERAKRMIKLSQSNARAFLQKQNLIDKKILEIGAGDGWLSAILASANQCFTFDMYVQPPRGLKAAEQYFTKDIFFERVVGDMIQPPFKEENFDSVIFCAALHHTSDLKKTLDEVNRVLKPGGKLYLINEPVSGLFGSKERAMVERDLQEGFHEIRYSLMEWLDSLRQRNFSARPHLPENMSDILRVRLPIGHLWANIWRWLPVVFKHLAVWPILTISDGFFNIVAIKQRKG